MHPLFSLYQSLTAKEFGAKWSVCIYDSGQALAAIVDSFDYFSERLVKT